MDIYIYQGQQAMTTERACIDLIQKYAQGHDSKYVVRGIGDDCAVLEKDDANYLLLTTDTLVAGVHFDLDWHPPYLLGRKCASVNLSDVAAMGGQPGSCLLSVGFPGSVPSWFEDFMSGFSSVLNEHKTILVGGDTVNSRNDFLVSVTIIGEVSKKHVCYRAGARPGDLIWVSGRLGNSAAGLALCRRGYCREAGMSEKWEMLIGAHLDPEPQVELGAMLSSSGLVHAMMDISDGLATDLAHLCRESGVGAEVRQDLLPSSALLESAASELDADALEWVLKGGEDYQLLFTTGESDEQKLRTYIADHPGLEISVVGRISENRGVVLRDTSGGRHEISYQGYDHFTEG